MIKESKTFETSFNPTELDTIETFFRYQEKIVSLFKLQKKTLWYW